MPNTLPILLLDPDGVFKRVKLGSRWRIHAFQAVDEATAGLAYLDPEVVLTTLGPDGLAFSRTVASRDPSRPVIMVASSPSTSDVIRAMRVGVRDIVNLDGSWAAALERSLDLALSWRKALEKGVALEVEQLRAQARTRERRVEVLEARVREVQVHLQAESSLLSQTQHELEVQRELALAAVRAKSRFLANMSHELHTPLNAIIGYAELLRETLEPSGGRDEAVHIIGSGRQLLALLQEVLNLARLEAGQVHPVFEPVSSREVLERVMHSSRAAAEAAQVRVTLGDVEVSEVVTDAGRLGEALGQLMDNAVKFSAGRSIELSVRRVPGDLTPWCVFQVADSGVGIESEDLERIFDAFTQGDGSSTRQFGGTGLGLAVSRQLARVLGGRLEARSVPGEGSVFEIWVPDAAPTSVSQAVDAELTLLVIDDDPVLRTLLNRMLLADGHAVVTSGSGRDAVELARQHQPALILLDVTLPGIDGFQVLSALQDDPAVSEIPVVMVSATPDGERALTRGARDFLPKPVHRESLRRVISQHARRVQSAGLLVVGTEVPSCLDPLVAEGQDVRPVPAHLLGSALEGKPGAVVLPAVLSIAEARTALQQLADAGSEVPVFALVSQLSDAESAYLEKRFAGVVSTYGDPSARLRRYASGQ